MPRALDLVVYSAGSDPLAGLSLTRGEMVARDLDVRGVPLAMVLAGGYGPGSRTTRPGALPVAGVAGVPLYCFLFFFDFLLVFVACNRLAVLPPLPEVGRASNPAGAGSVKGPWGGR